ncbi:MAG: molybdenum cofactor guanylyltransferase [Terriglobia bacterium]
MHRRFLQVTGFLLAGGKSRRMGQPKQDLCLGRETMLSRQLRLLRSVTPNVAILAPPESIRTSGTPVHRDAWPGRGPLGGIYTGLIETRTEYNLFLGCDLPFMNAQFLRFLCRCALESPADVIVPRSPDHYLQPLCAVYRRSARKAVQARLLFGENKVDGFFPRVRVQVVRFEEHSGLFGKIFTNMNTPADYQAARKLLTLDDN